MGHKVADPCPGDLRLVEADDRKVRQVTHVGQAGVGHQAAVQRQVTEGAESADAFQPDIGHRQPIEAEEAESGQPHQMSESGIPYTAIRQGQVFQVGYGAEVDHPSVGDGSAVEDDASQPVQPRDCGEVVVGNAISSAQVNRIRVTGSNLIDCVPEGGTPGTLLAPATEDSGQDDQDRGRGTRHGASPEQN